jgi:hypothetical protein
LRILVIDIFDEYIDFTHDFEETVTHRYGNVFIINDEKINIGNHIHNMVMQNKRDSVQTIIKDFKNITFVRLYLLLSKLTEKVDISYLIDFLENRYEVTNDDLININYDKYESFINIKLSELIETANLDEILGEFRNAGLQCEICSKEKNIYERGSSGVTDQIIIGIFGGFGSGLALLYVQDIINKLKRKSEHRKFITDYITFGNFDKNKLLLNLAREIKDVEIHKYHISSFNEINDEEYSVIIEKRDMKHEIICNREAEILKKKTTYFI